MVGNLHLARFTHGSADGCSLIAALSDGNRSPEQGGWAKKNPTCAPEQ